MRYSASPVAIVSLEFHTEISSFGRCSCCSMILCGHTAELESGESPNQYFPVDFPKP
jgi:hypothetical protein